ncbi:chorismate synthase [Stetteria hydrogenophila]
MIGRMFRVSIFGESHGKGVGALIEGCPPGIPVDEEYLARELARRRPGGPLTSPRREGDWPEILAGVFNGRTTGGPILVFIRNRDVDSSFYEQVVKRKPRPGHADYAARVKYWGFNDYRGGGHNSGRLTAGVVAAGAVARRLLELFDVRVYAYIKRVGSVEASVEPVDDPEFRERVYSSPVRCPDPEAAARIEEEIKRAVAEGDSLGGVVEAVAFNLPVGLGEPPMDGLDSDLAKALMSIPGVKGVEVGAGFRLASMRGSEAADEWVLRDGRVVAASNNMGGVNGGISNGMPLVVRVAFKPTSTIRKPLRTVDLEAMEETVIEGRGRHDPCIAIRGVAVVEAYVSIVLADHLLRWLAWQPVKSRILGER